MKSSGTGLLLRTTGPPERSQAVDAPVVFGVRLRTTTEPTPPPDLRLRLRDWERDLRATTDQWLMRKSLTILNPHGHLISEFGVRVPGGVLVAGGAPLNTSGIHHEPGHGNA